MTEPVWRLTNIERFATHDGPGIRTVLFFKGCGLHCPWCANPETWRREPELFHDKTRCVGCGQCVTLCSQSAIEIREGRAFVNRSVCNACGSCVKACLQDALEITGRDWSLSKILEEIGKDDDYYAASGGGVTLSGGEVFLQEVQPLLKALKKKGYHVAVETEGQFPLSALKEALPWLDLVYHDVKHCDFEKLRKVCGADLPEIEAHLRLLKESQLPVIIRVPLIPGFNDQELEAIIAWIRKRGFETIQLLPFHPLGKGKWTKLDRTYAFENEPRLKKEALERYRQDGITTGG